MKHPKKPKTTEQKAKPKAKPKAPAPPREAPQEDPFDFGGIPKDLNFKRNMGCGG
jgi:hypothetical protein